MKAKASGSVEHGLEPCFREGKTLMGGRAEEKIGQSHDGGQVTESRARRVKRTTQEERRRVSQSRNLSTACSFHTKQTSPTGCPTKEHPERPVLSTAVSFVSCGFPPPTPSQNPRSFRSFPLSQPIYSVVERQLSLAAPWGI